MGKPFADTRAAIWLDQRCQMNFLTCSQHGILHVSDKESNPANFYSPNVPLRCSPTLVLDERKGLQT